MDHGPSPVEVIGRTPVDMVVKLPVVGDLPEGRVGRSSSSAHC